MQHTREVESFTICTSDGEELQFSRDAVRRAGFLKDMIEHTEGNVLRVERAAPPVSLVIAQLASTSHGEASLPLADVPLEELVSAMEAANYLYASEAFKVLATELFRRADGLDVHALCEMLCECSACATRRPFPRRPTH